MSETPAAYGHESNPGGTDTKTPGANTPWERILIWSVIVVAFALLATAAVLLFLGVLELITVISPVLIAALLVWNAWLTIKTRNLEKRLEPHAE